MDKSDKVDSLKKQRFVNPIQPPSTIAVDLLNKFKKHRSDTKFADYNLREEDPINTQKNLGNPWPPGGIKNVRPTFSETMNDLTQNYYQKSIKTYVSIESQLRDTSYYPNPYRFTMYLNKKFNNIVKIKVLEISQKSPNLFNFDKSKDMTWDIYTPKFIPELVSDPDFDVEGNEKQYKVYPDVGDYVYEKFGEELFNAMNQSNVDNEDSLKFDTLTSSYKHTVGAYQITINNTNLSNIYLIGRYELMNFTSTTGLSTQEGSNIIFLKTPVDFMNNFLTNTSLPIILTGLYGVVGGIPLNLLNQRLFHAVDYGDQKANMKYNTSVPGFELFIYNDNNDEVNAYLTETIFGGFSQLDNAQYGRGLPFKINFTDNSYLKMLGFPVSDKYNTIPIDGIGYKFIHSLNDYMFEGGAINTDIITFGLQEINNSITPYLIPEPIFFLKLTFPNDSILENFIVATGYQNSDLEGYKTTSAPPKIVNQNEDFNNIFCKCKINTTPGSFGNIDIINAERIYYNSYVNNVDAILIEFISLDNKISKQLGEISVLLEITEVIPVLKETLINTKSNEIITAGKDDTI